MEISWDKSRIATDLEFCRRGVQIGDLRLKHSDNRHALGYIPIPVGVISGGEGPTVLLTGGVHGDEFEGPVALMKLLHQLDPDQVSGRLIVLPALKDRKSTRLNSSHKPISYAVFCLKKKTQAPVY